MIFLIYYKTLEKRDFIHKRILKQSNIIQLEDKEEILNTVYKKDITYFFTDFRYLSRTALIKKKGYTIILCLPVEKKLTMKVYASPKCTWGRHKVDVRKLKMTIPEAFECKKLSPDLNLLMSTKDLLHYVAN